MIIVLFAFWLLLNGHWTTEIAVTGAVLSVLIYLLCHFFWGYTVKAELQMFARGAKIVSYIRFLVCEIVKSALQTMRLIWSTEKIVVPKLVSFRTRLKTDGGKVALANSITLTPGTISVDVRGDKFLVHCLDEDFAEGLENSEMEQRLLHVEGEKKHE